MAVWFIELELWPIGVLHYVNRDFQPFCSDDLNLDRMTFIYELEPYSLQIQFVKIT